MNFVFGLLTTCTQSADILALVPMLEIASSNTTRTRHRWTTNYTSHQLNVLWAATRTRNTPLILQLLLAPRSIQHHLILRNLLLLIWTIASSLEHVNLRNIICKYAFLSILFHHIIVILQLTILPLWIHTVSMWRLKLLAMDM